jgi:hypothetical protein
MKTINAITVLMLIAACTLLAMANHNWKSRYETERDQFRDWRNGGDTNRMWSYWSTPKLEKFAHFGFKEDVGYVQCRTNLETGLAEMRVILKP